LTIIANLLNALQKQNCFDEAVDIITNVNEIYTRNLGGDEMPTIASTRMLAGALYEAGRLDEARQNLRKIEEICSRKLGPDHDITLSIADELRSIQDGPIELERLQALNEEKIYISTLASAN
jgi:tetratricopeptide (TPR) repeat protein